MQTRVGWTASAFDSAFCSACGNNRRENEFAYKVAQYLGKTITGGSDAHSTHGIGTYTTIFEEPAQSQEHLLTMLREGRTDCYEGLNIGTFQPFRPAEAS